MSHVTALWRHPIKAHGREALDRVTLIKGQAMPFDRLWAVAHDSAKAQSGEWAPCANFNRGARTAGLMAIDATLDPASEEITLRHPDLPDITLHPERDSAALLDWVRPLCDPQRGRPDRVMRLEGRGYTDTPFASISICNTASHAAVESLAMAPLQPERWRGNIWIEGPAAWEEFDWIGRDARLGTARLRIEERITRCKATTVNTQTGARDVDTLAALRMLDHQDFGIYATVVEGGDIVLGDRLELI
ncbi:MOSC domain-containing protein [Sulfitobacter albidus]|uniref:MOSC domain-containing protein n=1 Tax=Sulfitobacter albidus TaxID=2829501 RepID=A0A975JBX5_9RHOB|nr:MOSC domain-containing protein [Sulfitobacter albidus]QUJ75654.1 MOSC domain-containing protein [Sulfitobacter albidus]